MIKEPVLKIKVFQRPILIHKSNSILASRNGGTRRKGSFNAADKSEFRRKTTHPE